ncbi:MAG TPA: hypothetical protein VM100_01295 [Longimicrobiales bacterium]|nr:hypothetical protein [Longimicrobiales bacterium]
MGLREGSPYTVTVDEGARTVLLKGAGNGTTDDTLELIAHVLQTLRAVPGYHVLYDAVELQIESSPQAMMKVAQALFGSGIKYGRFAVVVPPQRDSLARIFTALANDNDVVADVFNNVSEARRWIYS